MLRQWKYPKHYLDISWGALGINKNHDLFLLRSNQPMGWALFSALLVVVKRKGNFILRSLVQHQ